MRALARDSRFALVLADDFQNLSAAQQTCLCLLARDQLIVAGNPDETVRVATSFPAPEGFATFDTLRRNVTVFTLDTAFGNPNVTAFCDAAARAGNSEALAADQREGTIRDIATVKWNTPDEEFNGLTRYLFAVNADDPEAAQSGICVVAPNKQWAHAFEQMLVRRGFTVSSLGFERLAGDPRDTNRARALVAYTSLNLLADPDDLFAWRAWLGFGNYLTYSDGWHFLMDWCDEHNAGILDALEAAVAARTAGEAEPFPRAERLAERYEAGRAMIAAYAGRRGHNLLAALGADKLRDFAALSATLAGDEDAATLYAMIRETQFFPTHEANVRAVRVSSYEQLCGCGYRALYVTGCVDGFMPARDAFEVVSTDADRARVREADAARLPPRRQSHRRADVLHVQPSTPRAGRAHEDAGGPRAHGRRRAYRHPAPHLLHSRGRRGRPHHAGRPSPPRRFGHGLVLPPKPFCKKSPDWGFSYALVSQTNQRIRCAVARPKWVGPAEEGRGRQRRGKKEGIGRVGTPRRSGGVKSR